MKVVTAEERLKSADLAHKQAIKIHKKCSRLKDETLRDPTVKFLVSAINKAGCPIKPDFFSCKPCEEPMLGMFYIEPEFERGRRKDKLNEPEITLCENHLVSRNKQKLVSTFVHELIHAYDHCRAKVVWTNPKHHACSEIRAAALSSDCWWREEQSRGFGLPYSGGHQRCVKRRAAVAVVRNGNVNSREEAMNAVSSVFDLCYNDPAPFDYQPVDW